MYLSSLWIFGRAKKLVPTPARLGSSVAESARRWVTSDAENSTVTFALDKTPGPTGVMQGFEYLASN